MMDNLQPIYRIEDFWYAIVNGLSCPHTPIYRIEQYLAYLCGADVSVPQPIYRIEQYLAYKCGLDVELPEPIYRQEMFLAKWCGMDVEPPTPIYRIEVLLSQLSNGYLKTVTGNPISVSDALAKPAESLTIEILPQQSGSGDPSPDNVRPISGWSAVNVTRMGKNLLDVANATHNAYNIGSIPNTLKMGVTYTFSVNGTTDKRYRLYLAKNDNPLNALIPLISDYIAGGNSLTFTAPNMDGYDLLCIAGSSNGAGNESLDNILPQIELGSTATVYEPYTGTTYPITWQDSAGTVYGGSLDVTSGVMTVTHKYYTYNGSENWGLTGNQLYLYIFGAEGSKSNEDTSQISNLFVGGGSSYGDYGKFRVQTNGAVCVGNRISEGVYNWNTKDEFKTFLSSNNLQICYELATPLVIQLTPTEIEMLLGNNVIWNDVGDMTLEYLADGPADDADALMILLGNRYVNNGGADEATDREALDILLGGNTR